MPTTYQSQIDSALQLIRNSGGNLQINLKVTTSGSIDPITQVSSVTTTLYPATGVMLPVPRRSYSQVEDDAPIVKNCAKLLLAAKGLEIEPKAGDSVIVDDVEWEVSSVDKLAPDGTAIIYNLIIER